MTECRKGSSSAAPLTSSKLSEAGCDTRTFARFATDQLSSPATGSADNISVRRCYAPMSWSHGRHTRSALPAGLVQRDNCVSCPTIAASIITAYIDRHSQQHVWHVRCICRWSLWCSQSRSSSRNVVRPRCRDGSVKRQCIDSRRRNTAHLAR